MARERTVEAQHAALDAVAADGERDEEIDDIVQGTAELKRKRAERGPVPRREDHRQRHIGQDRERAQADEESKRAIAESPGQSTQRLDPLRCQRMETNGK